MAKITKWLNPWSVESIEAFNFYCCPECNFRSNEANFFQVHALQNHDLSQALFNNLDLDIKVDIKLEQSETEPEIQLGINDEKNGTEEQQYQDDEFIDDSWSLTSRGSGIFCEICKVKMHKANFYRHLRTKLHIDKAAKYKGDPHDTQSDTEIDPLFEDNEKYQNEEDLYVFCEVCKIKLLKACLWKHLRTKRHRKQAGSDAEEYQSDVEIENKKRSGDYIENKEMWNVEVFRNLFLKNPRSIEGYKYEWASFCKLSYYDQQNPPTEEMYIDFIQKKKEAGKTDKAIYLIYLRLKKIALHVYGQSLQDFEKFKELIPHHSGLPSIYDNNGQEVSEEQNDNKINVQNNLPKHITDCGTNSNIEKNNDEVKKSGLDYIENKDIWKVDFFKDKRGRQLESYKLAWARFCKLSYHDQSNPPTREMYIDFFEQKLEEGRSSISIYNTYIALKKVALYVYGQKIQNMPQVRKLVPRNPGYTKKEPTKRGNDVGNYYWPIVTEKAMKTEECGEEDVIDDNELVENKMGVNKLLPKHIKEYDNSMEYEIKKKGLDYIENKEMWNVEFFKNKTSKQLDNYKYNWGNFCQLSYHDQQNPPTEEMYVDFIKKKKEEGRKDRTIYQIYMNLKRVALNVFGQKIQDFEKLAELIPAHKTAFDIQSQNIDSIDRSDLDFDPQDPDFDRVNPDFDQYEPDSDIKTMLKNESFDEKIEKMNCKLCDKEIKNNKSALQTHLRRHHSDSYSIIEKTRGGIGAHGTLDYIENKNMWNNDFFRKKNGRAMEAYKYEWGSFCKLSYHDQKNPPTEEMYIDFIKKKKELGKTDKAIYHIFLRLKKIAFYAYGQKIQKNESLAELIPHHSGEGGKKSLFFDTLTPKLPRSGSKVDDSGICPHCGEHFKWLQSHIKQTHEKEKPFKCDKCDMSFGTKPHLLSHAYYKHSEKNIYCDICGHKAKGRQDLRRHIEAKHEKLRNYACNVCEDTKFYSKWQLKMHTRVHHLGEKPFKCSECDATFTNTSQVYNHKRKVHTILKFYCPVCGTEYNCFRSMKRHALKAHGYEDERKRDDAAVKFKVN